MKKTRIFFFRLLTAVVLFFVHGSFADDDIRYTRIRDALNKFTHLYPQQKVYLHLDKGVYRANDIIWIKAYLVGGLDHLPDTLSTNLYVEIISPSLTRVDIKRFRMEHGFGTGDFVLSDTLPTGLYQIRAFTNWMQNFDTEYYFEKNFQVNNPGYSSKISPRQARLNKREIETIEKQQDDIDFQFMPEGGYLISGLESVIAFKAVNKSGKGVEVKGEIFNKSGNKVEVFSSRFKGIGSFTFIPVKGEKYEARVKYEGKEFKVALPEPLESGVVMHVENQAAKIVVNLRSNRQSSDPSANQFILIGQVGGKIYYSGIIRLGEGRALINIAKNDIPGGIMQLTLFSNRGTPLAERLVFIKDRGILNLSLNASDSLGDSGNKIVLKIHSRNELKQPVQANLSLAVTKIFNGQIEPYTENIVSNFLLSSDIKSYIDNPVDYFLLPEYEMNGAFDDLMLTNGWRRFSWEAIMAGEYPEIKYHEEKGLTVAGIITRDFFNLPLKNCKVQLSIMDKYNDVFTQYSKENGTFLFNNMVYYDTVHVKIEAWRHSGRHNLVIQLADEKQNAVTGYMGDYTLTTFSERNKMERRRQILEENKEVSEQQKKAMEERKKNSIEGIYGEPDFVMYSEDFGMTNGNILEVMQGRVPGVQITGNQVVIRGINSIFGSNQPLFLLDGMPVVDVHSIISIPLEDIERVEVLKGPKTAFYGSRGANGVIAVYTKRGQFLIRGKIEFSMLGYSTPREFYQPKYMPSNEPEENYTVLWIPEIITDENGKAVIVFDKPIEGQYRFDIQGLSYEGHVGYLQELISSE